MTKENSSFSRRQFIKSSAIGVAGSVLPAVTNVAAAKPKPTVVLVRHSKVIDAKGTLQQPLVKEMITKAMTSLTGKRSLEESLGEFVTPEDVVGLKVNNLGLAGLAGTDYVTHFTAVASILTDGLKKAKVKDRNIIIWERSDDDLMNAGFTIQKEESAVRVFGTKAAKSKESIGYSSESFPVGSKKSHVSKILTEMTSAMISVPVMKNHRLAGITGALKTHYGTVDNPMSLHGDNCTNPGIPEVNMIPVIKKKQKLIIADALLGVFNGGPWWKEKNIWPFGGILVATDPVAVDAVMLSIIDEKRKKEKLSLVKDTARHLPLSEKLGLGISSLDGINLVEINLG